MDEGQNMILLFSTLIKFESDEERERFYPTCHMFYVQRVVDIKGACFGGEWEIWDES